MRQKLIACALAAATFCMFLPSQSTAGPWGGANLGSLPRAGYQIESISTYCFNRYSGNFLHWGRCNNRIVYRTPGRTYCYSRYNGAFLHWGACY